MGRRPRTPIAARIAINPLHANARNNLGHLLERHREFAEAADQYREAIAAQPSFRLGRFNYGRMLLALGRAEEAIVEFERLQQPVDAETPRYVFALSTAYVRSGPDRRRASSAPPTLIAWRSSSVRTDLAAAIARNWRN